ncbi:MAG TPA: conjugative transposon protein TraM [Puia sp.]|nr:conjugative transposon protein TraM [Puia sp.]
METKTSSAKFTRQRRFFLILPLLVLPFVIILFALFGGGKGNAVSKNEEAGLNFKLPDAHFRTAKEKDKLGLYEEAGKDSARLRDAMKNDPYYKMEHHADTISTSSALQTILNSAASKYNQPTLSNLKTSVGENDADPNAKRIMDKLAQLKKVMNNAKRKPADIDATANPGNPSLEQLQDVVNRLQQKRNSSTDPELNQLNEMLDKVMLLQHPEKMQDSMTKLSEKNKPKTFLVSKPAPDAVITSMNNRSFENGNGFYGLDDHSALSIGQNAVEAIIPETQTLVAGATVKIRLLNDIYVGGLRIPKDQFIYGTASLSNERLKIAINSVGFRASIIPVSLSVYDLDGMEGIYIPGSINRDVTKQSADDAISAIGLTTLDPSLAAQATSAGIQAAKSLISKKVKLVRVTLKEGYRVLLKDNNQK